MRRGESTISLILLLTIIGSAAVAAVVITPRVMKGADSAKTALPPGFEPRAATSPAHQAAADGLAAVLGRSTAVLAVHPAELSGRSEVTLWTTDHENPGELDPDEIAVISHSRVMQTLTFFTLSDSDEPSPPGSGGVSRGPDVLSPRSSPPLDLTNPADVALCGALRGHPDAAARLIARGLSDVEFQFADSPHADPAAATDSSILRIELTWVSDSADPPDSAVVLVEVAGSNRVHMEQASP